MLLLQILFFTFFLLTTAFAAPSTTPSSSHNAATPLCSTSGCKEAAAIFKNAMNSSVDPCNDFYEYSCGGWASSHAIPEWKSRTGVTEELEETQREDIRKVLEKFDPKIKTNISVSASVSLSAYFYQSCVHLGAQTPEVGVQKLVEVVGSIRGGVHKTWKLGQQVKLEEEKALPKWEEGLVELFANGAIDAIFSVSISPDPKNVSELIINLDPAGLGLGEKDLADLTKNPKLVTAYKNLIKESAELLCKNGSNKCPTSEALNADISEILQLESDLAKALMPMEDRRDPEKTYNKLTLEELKAKTQFDWLTKYLLPLWKALQVDQTTAHIDTSSKVLVSDLEYLHKAVAILEKTSQRVLDNYFGWLAVFEFSSLSSETFRDVGYQFAKVSQGITKKTSREKACFGAVDGALNWALGRLFVETFSDQEKAEAAAIIDEVQSAFVDLLTKNSWLDEKTRADSISKMQHIRKNVAYPTWIRDNKQLDEYHGLSDPKFVAKLLSESNYIQSYRKYSVNSVKKFFEGLHKPINVDKNWPFGPFIVNAAYEPEQNSITIPAGQLKAPFFNINFPLAVNFGDIGALVGHELTHGLDDEGRQFDESGNFHSWWSDEAVEKFTNRSDCFVKQYSEQKDKVTGLHLNGQNTLGENIADNGGLNEAFLAYKKVESKKGPSPRLADLPHLTADQLFFISYGFSWCSSVRPEAMRNQIEYNVHSPAMYRVNVPVSNSFNFAKAFNCPVGSPMNPIKKCQLW